MAKVAAKSNHCPALRLTESGRTGGIMRRPGAQALGSGGRGPRADTAIPSHVGPTRPYGQRVPQSGHNLDVCRSQGVHWKDKQTRLSLCEGSCSQSPLLLALSKTRNTTHVCVRLCRTERPWRHRGRAKMKTVSPSEAQ